jgi:hypothetical protein
VEPAELSDDMISQGSFENIQNVRRIIPPRRSQKLVGAKKCAQDLVVFGYRMPVARNDSRSRSIASQISSVSDGFEGKEANPVGKLMQIKQTSRPRQPAIKVASRMGTLKFVEAKPDNDTRGVIKHQTSKRGIVKFGYAPSDNEDLALPKVPAPAEGHIKRSDLAHSREDVELTDGGKIYCPLLWQSSFACFQIIPTRLVPCTP